MSSISMNRNEFVLHDILFNREDVSSRPSMATMLLECLNLEAQTTCKDHCGNRLQRKNITNSLTLLGARLEEAFECERSCMSSC